MSSRQLKFESTRAVLEQRLKTIHYHSQLTSKFLSFVVISKKFLNCSACKYNKIYRFVLHDAIKGLPMFSLSSKAFDYSLERTCSGQFSHSFKLSVEQTRALIKLSKPPIVEIHIRGDPYNINFCRFAPILLSSRNSQIVFHSTLEFEKIKSLLSLSWPNLIELGCNPALIPNNILPQRNLAACKLYMLKNLGQVKEVLKLHRIKKLFAETFLHRHEDASNLAMTTNSSEDDQLVVSRDLRHFDFRVFSFVESNLYPFLCQLKKFAPNLESISIKEHFYDSIDQNSDSAAIVQRILFFHQKSCELATKCNQTFSKVSIKFRISINFKQLPANSDWATQLGKEVKIADKKVYSKHTFLTLDTKNLAESLLFKSTTYNQ